MLLRTVQSNGRNHGNRLDNFYMVVGFFTAVTEQITKKFITKREVATVACGISGRFACRAQLEQI